MSSPELQRAVAMLRSDRQLLRDLVSRRKALGLSQAQVAERLGLKQPTVAAFERYDSDPKFSAVRRYAHALGVVVTHEVHASIEDTRAPSRDEFDW